MFLLRRTRLFHRRRTGHLNDTELIQRGEGLFTEGRRRKQSIAEIPALNTHIKRHPSVEPCGEAPRSVEQEDPHCVGHVCFIDNLVTASQLSGVRSTTRKRKMRRGLRKRRRRRRAGGRQDKAIGVICQEDSGIEENTTAHAFFQILSGILAKNASLVTMMMSSFRRGLRVRTAPGTAA